MLGHMLSRLLCKLIFDQEIQLKKIEHPDVFSKVFGNFKCTFCKFNNLNTPKNLFYA